MSLNKKELFEILIKQLNLNDRVEEFPLLDSGKVESVTVHKQNDTWDLVLTFDAILPFKLYRLLETAIIRQIPQVKNVILQVRANNNEYNEKLVQDYWQHACQVSGVNSPICNKLFKNSLPIQESDKMIFYVEHEITLAKFKNEIFPMVETAYHQFGFPKQFKIKPVVNKEENEKLIAQFKEEKIEKEKELMIEMTEQSRIAEEQRQKINNALTEGPLSLGRSINDNEPITQMSEISEEESNKVFEGYVFDIEIRDLRSGRRLLMIKMTDYTSSFLIKKFSNNSTDEELFDHFKEGMWLKVKGNIQEDTFINDLVMMANSIKEIKREPRKDNAPEGEKRVELHAHTTMSQMDAIISAKDLVNKAASFNQQAVAITDHAVLQSFPEAHYAGLDTGVKVLYGVEANIVSDGEPVAYNEADIYLADATYVVFDVETTGLSAIYDKIIELAAVKFKDGEIIEEFQEFIDPGHPLSETTINLTGITDQMVTGSKSEEEVLKMFKDFTKDTILVAHNASFDMGFINTAYDKHKLGKSTLPVIDTLELSRMLHPHIKSHRLNTLAKRYDVLLEQHHRAIYDSQTTAKLLWIFLKEAKEDFNITNHNQLNSQVGKGDAYKQSRPTHATLLVQTQEGLKNLFKIVSHSLVNYYYRVPRVPKSILNKYRDGIMIGSGCSQGEVFEAIMQKGYNDALEVAKGFDYIEIMPKSAYVDLIDRELVTDEKTLEDILSNLVKIGKELDIPVVATGNVHYLDPEDSVYRDILLETAKKGAFSNTRNPDVHFRTTDEMLNEFAFLGKDVAKEVVVTNTQKIADSIDSISPVKNGLFAPKMAGSDDQIRQMSYDRAKELYGSPLPEIVEARLEKELKSIIENDFSVIYLISQKLVQKSIDDGYLVGSRGSVGSSFVATMTGITEVNPLAPHYRCPNCQYSEFFTKGEVGSGYDLEEKSCPKCETIMDSDGQDIPFETFLGFKGDKVPDIDLNFSGEYQAKAHNYTKILFGEDHVYRAGTITTIAEKTAFGFVKGYERDKQLMYRSAEIDRLAKGVTGVKRSTGQHPGGIIVIPEDMDVFDFTPIQYPADDQSAEWRTTHFDFHSIDENVLKLDILGHDDPTMIRKLQDLSGIDPLTIPVKDKDVMKIFSGTEVLGVTPEQIFSKTGTLGVPEFGTQFVREMLDKTHPSTFAELLQISGLSHGTDVWLGNAEELIRNHDIPLSEVIGCRDDIMVYLQHKGLEDDLAFKIMEFVRKGRGLSEEWIEEMKAHNVPQWYIESCLKIKYMFPKAHAAAYVLMALRVAYFKVHYPLYYYAAYFSIRANDFDLVAMAKGKDAIKSVIGEIKNREREKKATAKDKSLLTVLEVANEMVERGFEFKMVDIDKSDASDFLIEGDALRAPFRAVPSLGMSVAKTIVEERDKSDFLSKEDLSKRGKVSKTVIEYMDNNHVLDHLPDENQLSLFDV
ncbi:MAG TPA: PolC-type DNA polymerase III [Alloiococcus sp.]|nr:PolC-type DNA polymerase III [Alloiococcus sp.]